MDPNATPSRMSAKWFAWERIELDEKLWSVPLPSDEAVELERLLRSAEAAERARRASDRLFELYVDRYAGLRFTVRSNEHPPPHFHVHCATGEASFRIVDGHLLAGNLQKEAPIVGRWLEKNRKKVIDAWNRSRPSDCPVGAYVEG